MILKDTFKLIKQTLKRFITIVSIVLIGVAFMMGLMSTNPIMKESYDVYTKQNNLHDIQVYSNYGFSEEDINNLKDLNYIKDVYGSKQIDSYCEVNNGEILVSRIRELNSNINKFDLKDGKLPEKDNEVLVIASRNGEIKLGDKFKLYLSDDNINDSLQINEFTVVGYAESSEYMSKFLSSSNYKNLDLDLIIYANNNIFKSEYYTCAYISLKDSNLYKALSDEYFDYVDSVTKQFDEYKVTHQNDNRDSIYNEALQRLNDAKEAFEDEKQKNQEKLDDAYKQLQDAYKKIKDGEKQIKDGEAELISGQKQIDDGYKQIQDNQKRIEDGKTQVIEELGKLFPNKSFDEIYDSIESIANSYFEIKDNYNSLAQKVKDIKKEYPNGILEIDLKIITLNPLSKDYLKQLNKLREYKNTIERYDLLYVLLENNFSKEITNAIEEYYPMLKQLKDGEQQLIDAKNELKKAQIKINDGKVEINKAKEELEKGKKEYYDGLQKYQDGKKEFEDKIREAEYDIEDAEKELKDLENGKWTVLDRNMHYTSYMYKNTCAQMYSIGIVMPLLFFLVAALVCMTTMTRLVDEQRGQIGIYEALGYSDAYIYSKYLLYVLIASLLGSIPGVLIGMAIFPTVIYTTWRLLYLLPNMVKVLPLSCLIISISSFAILMMIVTYLVLRKSLIEKPSQLMRPKSPKNSKAVFLEKIKFIWERLSFTSKITARNLIRYKSRFFMTVIGVAGCAGLLVLGWGIKDSIADIVNVQYGDFFNYNYTISLSNDHYIDEIIDDVKLNESIDKVVPYMSYMAKVELDNDDTTINVMVLTPNNLDSAFNLYDYSNNQLLTLSNDGIILTEKFAKTNDINVGDLINVESKDGTICKVKVEDICKMYFQHYAFMSEELYSKLYKEDIEYNNIAINSIDDSSDFIVIKDKYKNINNIADFIGFTKQFNTMIEALDLIIAVIIVTAGALALVVLINLIQVNISERVREIATFKVLGFRNFEINTYIFKEIIILTVIGGIIGMPLGKLELDFVMSVIDMDMVMFPTSIKPISYLYGFVITMIFTAIVLILFRKPLRKIDMIESLKSVE